jgi:Fumarate hydratase (Fumerase)
MRPRLSLPSRQQGNSRGPWTASVVRPGRAVDLAPELNDSTCMPITRRMLDEVAFELNRRAAIAVPVDAKLAHRQAAERETNPLARYVLDSVVENAELAVLDQRPMCGDTGLPRYYVKLGNAAVVDGGLVELEHSLRTAVARATQEVQLRSNRVHPLTRRNPGNNVGVFAPNIDYRVEPEATGSTSLPCTRVDSSVATTACSFLATVLMASSASCSTRSRPFIDAGWPARRR